MTKQALLEMIRTLPDDADFEQLANEVEKVHFQAQVRRGLAQLERGESIPHVEVEAMMDDWLRE